jgi:hypothetical protein
MLILPEGRTDEPSGKKCSLRNWGALDRLQWATHILVPQMLDSFQGIFDLLIPKMAPVFPYQL